MHTDTILTLKIITATRLKMKELLFRFAEEDNFTINEVRTILRISLVFDKDDNIRQKYKGADLTAIWEKIPNKEILLEVYNNRNKKRPKY